MIALIAVFISCFLGYLVLRCLRPKEHTFDLTDLFLMIGLGSGISSQIVFYSLLVSDHIDPVLIIFIHLLGLCFLFYYLLRRRSKLLPVFVCPPVQALVFSAILFLAFAIAALMAVFHPWGAWDGWAYWNFHANFLFNSGYGWHRLFEFNIQAHHPWMLPLMVIWGWCFCPNAQPFVPFALGIIFTVSTVGLLVASLKRHVPFFWAALGGVFLTSVPYFTLHGISQYADIEAAFFILLSCVLAIDFLKAPSFDHAVLTGLCLGFSSTLKENCIPVSLFMMVLINVRSFRSGRPQLIRPLNWGFIAIAVSVVLMRSFEIFPSGSHSYGVFLPGIWDWHKWGLIGKYVLKSLIAVKWGGLWLLALGILLLQRAKWAKAPTGDMVRLTVFYLIFNFFIFVISALDLEWLLGVAEAYDRMLYLLAPTVIFVAFYAVGHKE